MEIKRFTCGSGDGMFENKEGFYVEFKDFLKLKEDNEKIIKTINDRLEYLKEEREKQTKLIQNIKVATSDYIIAKAKDIKEKGIKINELKYILEVIR